MARSRGSVAAGGGSVKRGTPAGCGGCGARNARAGGMGRVSQVARRRRRPEGRLADGRKGEEIAVMLQPFSTRRAASGARFVQAAGFVLAAAAATLVASPARGATACKNVSCATSCSPSAPVAISTLIDAGDFPVGGTTP